MTDFCAVAEGGTGVCAGEPPLGLAGGGPEVACLATALTCFFDVKCAS